MGRLSLLLNAKMNLWIKNEANVVKRVIKKYSKFLRNVHIFL